MRKKNYRSFSEARKFIHSLGVKTEPEWREWKKKNKRPDDIPGSPEVTYKKQWRGMGYWFGTGNIANYKSGFMYLYCLYGMYWRLRRIYQRNF